MGQLALYSDRSTATFASAFAANSRMKIARYRPDIAINTITARRLAINGNVRVTAPTKHRKMESRWKETLVRNPRSHPRATVFIELLVIIAIIGMLIAILIPMFLSARQRSTRFKCQNNLREIGNAMFSYANSNHGRFPSTRPSADPIRKPDLSNSGYAATQPFAPDGPRPNNIPAAIFLLI